MKKFKEYLGISTIRVGGLDSINPIASLGDTPPKGKGSKDTRAVGLTANYDTQAPGTMRPAASTYLKKLKEEDEDEDKELEQFLKDLSNNTPNSQQFDEDISLQDVKNSAKKFVNAIYNKLKRMVTTKQRYEYAAKTLQSVIDRKKRERYPEPLRHDIGYYAAAVGNTFHDIDPKKLQTMIHEQNLKKTPLYNYMLEKGVIKE